MKMFNLNLRFVDGSTVTLPIDQEQLNTLKENLHEIGFNMAFCMFDGLINFNHVCHLTWEEK